ncbi:MAG: hypothetical protein EAZ47_05110 [Bacteroidetes bacterium]|nr:MAG: hypothetical protein EAY72_04275 [Bacteroidota bacterium]TAF93936.1 MAG: hypothetical protein EAZ47_05110 [Bacteroidota bacterium]
MQTSHTKAGGIKRLAWNIARWFILILFATAFFLLLRGNAYGQSNINYVEYYLDQDPGQGRGTPISVTAATNIANIPINLDVTTISRGVHILATRARSATGVWSFSHYWYLFKPYLVLEPNAVSNVVRVEYFIDTDPGMGNAINVPITSGVNLTDLTFSFSTSNLSSGPHTIGARALTANGSWTLTNFWVFIKPLPTLSPATLENVSRLEYFVNTDPGIGNGINIPITAGTNLENINFPLPVASLPNGAHLVGFRARTVGGSWSHTNNLLFVKPYPNLLAGSRPNITAMEYFLDYDPGIGRGISVPISADTNYTNLTFNVNLTGIVPGTHFVQARTRDANGNWSKVNSWQFTIPGTPPTIETIVNGNTFCAGTAVNIAYNIPTAITFNANNRFVVQLSDNSGSFTNPTAIGELASTALSGNVSCTIPAAWSDGSGYRFRVVATSQTIIGSANATNITINRLPPMPQYSTPLGDTSICVGNPLTLTATNNGFTPQWLFNGNAISGANNHQYAMPAITAAQAGVYRLRLVNASTCVTLGNPISVTVNPNSPTAATVSPSGSIGICVGNSQTLTSSITSNIQWQRNGVNIAGATTATYAVNGSGTYTVVTTNPTSGCQLVSSNNAVVSLGAALTVPTILANGPVDICSNSSVQLTSSAAPNYQWYRNGVLISGAVGQSISASLAGTYTVQISGNNCSATSLGTVVTVNTAQAPSVVLSSPGSTGAAGSVFSFSATPTNGGNAPSYNFRVNGNNVQTGLSNTYSSTNFQNGDVVSCVLTSNFGCLTTTQATSNTFTIAIVANVSISGVARHPVKGNIPSVLVRFTGGITDSISTAVSAFNIPVAPQRNYTISPTKYNDVNRTNGVNVLDVVAMQSHILNRTILNTPFKIIAADANSDNAVNILDIIAVKRLILGIDQVFAGNKLWSFVDSSFVFTNPSNPFPYASTRTLSNISTASTNNNFFGVKLGDVNMDWDAVPGQNRTTAKPLMLYMDTVYATVGDVVRLAIKVKDFNGLLGAQFACKFDASVFDFVAVENKLLPIDQNTMLSTMGQLRFVWADNAASARTFADGTVLFELVLRKKSASSQSILQILDSDMQALAFTKDNQTAAVIMQNGMVLENRPAYVNILMEQLDLSPNPSRGFLKATIVSKEPKTIRLIAQHISGTKVLEQVVKLDAGVNVIQLNLQAKQAIVDGMYYIQAIGLEGVKTKSVIVSH